MAIRPEDIPSFVDGLVEAATNFIDPQLRSNWGAEKPRSECTVHLTKQDLWSKVQRAHGGEQADLNESHKSAMERLIKEYDVAGWSVEWDVGYDPDSQKCRPTMTFAKKPPIPGPPTRPYGQPLPRGLNLEGDD
jgi:hypothetical protein